MTQRMKLSDTFAGDIDLASEVYDTHKAIIESYKSENQQLRAEIAYLRLQIKTMEPPR